MKAPSRMISPMTDPIDSVFGTSGVFAKTFAGYQPRPEQVKFTRAVASAFAERRTLLAEAPTGTGKSLGYLVPAIQAIAGTGRKVVIATANIALQEQLVRKDLPMLQRVLKESGTEFTFALAKGFSNYICQDARDTADTDRMMGKRLPVIQDQEILEQAIAWSNESETGDLSDFETELPYAVRKALTIASEDCLGKKCQYFGLNGTCNPRKARRSFGAADVIVTNYHLYFLDLEMKRRGARGVLPEHELLVCDEAHNVAEIARTFLGERVSAGGIKNAVDELNAKGRRAEKLDLPRELDKQLQAEILAESAPFFADALALRKDARRYRARLNKPDMIDGSRLETLLRKASTIYLNAAARPGLESEAREWLRHRSALVERYAGVLAGARGLDDEENLFYLDEENGRVSVVREPVSPAKILREALFESEATPHGIVLCSATLSAGGRDGFEYAAEQVGCDTFDTCLVESPFDYSRSAFIVPNGLPEPTHPTFADAVGETLVATVKAARGRTLALFTSYRVLDIAHRRLLAERLPYTVMRQDDAPRSVLIARFKADPSSVLLGTESFWEGVDVPGDALMAVMIDKIPFDHFEDPVLDAIKERDSKWFPNYYLPKAVIKFKQGFGRLIRSVDDFGVVVCCDKRITSKPYGSNFKRAVPKATRFGVDLGMVARICGAA